MEYKYTGIILSKRDVGETDRLYSIYTQEMGKIQSLAVGVRKPQSKLASSLENFNLIDFSMERTRGTGKITGVIVENDFFRIKNQLELVLDIFENIKIVDRLVGLEEKDENIFNLLYEYLELINNCDRKEKDIVSVFGYGFMFKIISYLGYGVEAGRCVICSEALNSSGEMYFSPKEGGVVCDRNHSAGDSFRISANSVKLMRIFLSNSLNSLNKLKVTKKELNEMKLILDNFLNWVFD